MGWISSLCNPFCGRFLAYFGAPIVGRPLIYKRMRESLRPCHPTRRGARQPNACCEGRCREVFHGKRPAWRLR
ncbi:hypothetical protein DO73_3217 [Burkholderia pseudomallei]|nr:hypothetical protein DO73_3217 [Burkholderia pseudomallei]